MLIAAALVLGSLTHPCNAAPAEDNSLPPAAGGGWHDTDAFDVWMAAIRNLRYVFGFSPTD